MTILVTRGTEKRAGAMAWTRPTKADWPEVRLENSQIVTAINVAVAMVKRTGRAITSQLRL